MHKNDWHDIMIGGENKKSLCPLRDSNGVPAELLRLNMNPKCNLKFIYSFLFSL